MKMKNKRYSNIKLFALISSFVLMLIMVSCDDVLNDVKNLGSYPEAGTFDDEQTTNAFLSNIYAGTLGGWPVNSGNNADECGGIVPADWITTSNGNFNYWPYDVIRKVNILLKEVPAGKIAEAKKGAIIGQAKFLRAFLYFRMVYYYGGVPIIDKPQELSDDLLVKRNTTAECFDFILKDLNEAATMLPVKFSGSDRGKIDQAAVKAFIGRVLLYKASPQFNSTNPYDNKYWTDAYNANKAAKNFLDANGYGLLENYVNIFETEGHKENILSVVYKNPAKANGRQEDAVRPLSESRNATGGDQPIWALAEAYPMKDGKKPGDPTSAYSYDVQTFWKNRDPRFAANLVWNGDIYELSGIVGRRQYTMSGIAKSMDAFGFIVLGEAHYRTGLYCRKGIMEQLPITLVATNDVDWPEIRYTEVLFNYAETANETDKGTEAVDVLKSIRKRAGIEAGNNGMYGLKEGMSRTEIRKAILDEKFIEMAFEGQRFWDLRRHRMLNTLNGMRKYGIMATKVNGHTREQVTSDDLAKANKFELLPENFEYSVEELITSGTKQMVMPDKYIFFPIQLTHIDKNKNLLQNKDWGGTFNSEL